MFRLPEGTLKVCTQLIITLTCKFGTKQKNSQEHLVGQAGGICPLAA